MARESLRVLVIDDDPDLLMTVSQVLEAEGFVVSVCSSGAQALEWFKQNEPPSVILLDVSMPQMDGWKLWQESRYFRHIRDVPVIIITGDSRMERMAQLTGVAGFVRKPLEADPLIAKIRSVAAKQELPFGGLPHVRKTDPY